MITVVESAIILAVPEAEPLVGALRLEGDDSAAQGVPAHVTLLYPFVDDPDDGIVEELRFFFAGVDAFPLTFTAVGEWPELVYLEMDEADEVHGLIAALVRRWPGYPPYGGLFELEDVVPHLTVVDSPDAELRERAATELAPGLPVQSAAREASLWVRGADGWEPRATFPLAEPELELG
jgi:2'-5' RNA ligase